MTKGQWLSEIKLGNGESLRDCINQAVAMCKEEHDPTGLEIHQIVSVRPDEFLILINYYK